jgi:hypothetical protein
LTRRGDLGNQRGINGSRREGVEHMAKGKNMQKEKKKPKQKKS